MSSLQRISPNNNPHADKEHFTFTWTIENFDMCPQAVGRELDSPTFAVSTLRGRVFQLQFYPRGYEDKDIMTCLVVHKTKTPLLSWTVATIVNIQTTEESKTQLSLIETNLDEYYWWGDDFRKRTSMVKQKDIFFPNNTLTLQFKIWRVDTGTSSDIVDGVGNGVGDMVQSPNQTSEECDEECDIKTDSNQCFARTRIGVRKCWLLWPIKIFPCLSQDSTLTKSVYFALDTEPSFQLAFCLNGELEAEERWQLKIRRKLSREAPNALLKIKIMVVNAQGDRTYHEQEEEHIFQSSDEEQVFKFSSSVKLSELKEQKYFDSTQNVLILRCQLASAEEADHEHFHGKDDLEPPCKRLKLDAEVSNISLGSALKRAYEENEFCDITLRCHGEEYSTHKVVLCTMSRVFNAMFKADMQEKNSGVVDITDLDPNTLYRMLEYLYTDQLGDISPTDAVSLYRAADKYEIHSLKLKCAGVLKSCLTVSTACEVLQLSDMHQDSDLMDSVQDFIHLHSDEVFFSPEWENWARSNSHLAADVMLKKLKRKVYRI